MSPLRYPAHPVNPDHLDSDMLQRRMGLVYAPRRILPTGIAFENKDNDNAKTVGWVAPYQPTTRVSGTG